MDAENRQPKDAQGASSQGAALQGGTLDAMPPTDAGGVYTLADVPRLAEYSASLYASTPAEHAHYVQYYTDYYMAEIKKGGGQFGGAGGGGDTQLTEANSGAAVALSAIQRKQKKMNSIETTATAAATAAAQAAAAVKATFAAQNVIAPRGNDGKTYREWINLNIYIYISANQIWSGLQSVSHLISCSSTNSVIRIYVSPFP